MLKMVPNDPYLPKFMSLCGPLPYQIWVDLLSCFSQQNVAEVPAIALNLRKPWQLALLCFWGALGQHVKKFGYPAEEIAERPDGERPWGDPEREKQTQLCQLSWPSKNPLPRRQTREWATLDVPAQLCPKMITVSANVMHSGRITPTEPSQPTKSWERMSWLF